MTELPPEVSAVVHYFHSHPLPHQGAPMLYQPFHQLDPTRLPSVIEGVRDRDDMFVERSVVRRPTQRINTHTTKVQEHNADVMLGLLYQMVGGVDETHDLVLPYSLPCDTEWGGRAVHDSPALGNATYAHALVHRSEGRHVGELGLAGWDNARTWFCETPPDHVMFGEFSGVCEALEAGLSGEGREEARKRRRLGLEESGELVQF